MSLDDMFKHPEKTNLSDSQFEMLLAQRRDEKRARTGLIGFAIIMGAVTLSVIATVSAAIITNNL